MWLTFLASIQLTYSQETFDLQQPTGLRDDLGAAKLWEVTAEALEELQVGLLWLRTARKRSKTRENPLARSESQPLAAQRGRSAAPW